MTVSESRLYEVLTCMVVNIHPKTPECVEQESRLKFVPHVLC
jgi:hypothetical protein